LINLIGLSLITAERSAQDWGVCPMQRMISLSSTLARPESGRFGAGLIRLAKAVALAPIRFYRARAELSALAALDEHQLRDIGLSRADLLAIDLSPMGATPTQRLSEIVGERRRYRTIFSARR
jgi:uncharacterized protein YjiS (DUF1127 family)